MEHVIVPSLVHLQHLNDSLSQLYQLLHSPTYAINEELAAFGHLTIFVWNSLDSRIINSTVAAIVVLPQLLLPLLSMSKCLCACHIKLCVSVVSACHLMSRQSREFHMASFPQTNEHHLRVVSYASKWLAVSWHQYHSHITVISPS